MNTKTRVYLETVKKNTFSGYVYASELPAYIQAMFPGAGETINVEGDYEVQWDDDIPMPTIEGSVILFDGQLHTLVNIDAIDYMRLEEDLYQDGPIGAWEEDRISSAADRHDEGER